MYQPRRAKGTAHNPGRLRQKEVKDFLVEVYERVGKSVIWVCEWAQRANR